MQAYWIWLAQITALNQREKKKLLTHFQDIQALYRAEKDALQALGLREKALDALARKDLSTSLAIVQACARQGIGILTYEDASYPNQLRQLPDPPLVLYYTGKLPDFRRLAAIAVVGTRKASAFGLDSARRMAGEIARCGGAVISGMAWGIDSAAIAGALDDRGTALGVLGGGIDQIYPASSRELYERVRRDGCLLSEYPPGTVPRKWLFPQRNRIISGLSLGVLVVEAPEKSGALITARLALEQNRDVFTLAGDEGSPTFAGNRALLRQGALAVSSGWDILASYTASHPGQFRQAPVRMPHSWDIPGLPFSQNTGICRAFDKKDIDKASPPAYSCLDDPPSLSPQAQSLLDALAQGEEQIDRVIARAGLDPGQALAVMTTLEIQGLIFRPTPQRVALKK